MIGVTNHAEEDGSMNINETMAGKAEVSEERVVLTMTREQAYSLMHATELLARLHIGQTFTLSELLGDLSAKDYCERRDRAREAFDLGLRILYGTNAYGYPDISEKSIEHERCWALYTTVRYALAWHDNPEGNMWSVAFDEPLGYGEEMPKCEITTDRALEDGKQKEH